MTYDVCAKVGDSLRAEDRRAALAKKKLMRDQQRLRAIMQRIKASRRGVGPRDLHAALKLISAHYDVDLPNGYTRQLNGEFASECRDSYSARRRVIHAHVCKAGIDVLGGADARSRDI